MARNDESQRGNDAPSRVYKSSDVHKRRVDRKKRSKGDVVPPEPKMNEGPASVDAAPEDHVPRQAPANPAVVLSPEFGRRSEAQREADERWFAAMREDDLSGPKATADQRTQPLSPVEDGQPAQSGQPATSQDEDQPSQPGKPADSEGPAQSEQPEKPTQPEQPKQAGQAEQPSQPDPPEQRDRPDQAEQDDRVAASDKDPSKRTAPTWLLSSRKARIALIVGSIVLVAVIVVSALFAWNRWYRFDDHADMQGTWYVVGTTVPVAIDETSIHLTDDVTYVYEINQQDKTINYTFGPMSGQGRYWFSDDRQYLVITDGDEFTGTSTAVDDLLHAFADMGDKVSGNGVKLPEGEGIIVFSREPDAEALKREQKAAAEKAAAEEAARKAAEAEAARIAAEEAAAQEEYYYEEEPAEEAPAAEAPAEQAPAEQASAGEPSAEDR